MSQNTRLIHHQSGKNVFHEKFLSVSDSKCGRTNFEHISARSPRAQTAARFYEDSSPSATEECFLPGFLKEKSVFNVQL
jgi:hypothetical protein